MLHMKVKDIVRFRKKKGLLIRTRVSVMYRAIRLQYYKVMLCVFVFGCDRFVRAITHWTRIQKMKFENIVL
jgi:hypothetical protein